MLMLSKDQTLPYFSAIYRGLLDDIHHLGRLEHASDDSYKTSDSVEELAKYCASKGAERELN